MHKKMSVVSWAIAAGLILVMAAGIVSAAPLVPGNFSYQGKLTDTAGNPLTGAYSMRFNLYDVASGGTALSTDTHSVTTSNGLFETTFTADPDLFDGQALWLGIRAGTDPEMTPRQEIRPVPYAIELVPPTRTRTISFPANSLNYMNNSAIIRQGHAGLLWSRDYQNSAVLTLMRPADWDGTSAVTLNIYFYPVTSTAGNVAFFIRPRSYDPGDTVWDADSMNSGAVAVSQQYILRVQTFTIPAATLNNELWYISIQNQGTGSTYPDDVMVTTVGLTYNAMR